MTPEHLPTEQYEAQLAEKVVRLQKMMAPFAAPVPEVFRSPVSHYRMRAEFRLCGLTQKISDGASSAVKSVFYRQVKTLRLDFSARNALNTDNREDNSASQPVMVRVYVLKDRKTFDKTVYQQLAAEGEDILKDDQLASRSLVLKPGTEMSLTMPLDEQAQYVAVVALFRAPDLTKNDWKLVLAREDLDPDRARVIEASHHQLVLQPRKEK